MTEEKQESDLYLDPNKESNQSVYFYPDKDAPWLMKIEKNEEGFFRIYFNRSDYPNVGADEFAEAVLKILSNVFIENEVSWKKQKVCKND